MADAARTERLFEFLIAEQRDPDAGFVVPGADFLDRRQREEVRLVEDDQGLGAAHMVHDLLEHCALAFPIGLIRSWRMTERIIQLTSPVVSRRVTR